MKYGIIHPDGSIEHTHLLKWAQWYESCPMSLIEDGGRVVQKTVLSEDLLEVSTVFLGIDLCLGDAGPSVFFETMVFGGEHDGHTERSSTLEGARQAHQEALDLIGDVLPDPPPQDPFITF